MTQNRRSDNNLISKFERIKQKLQENQMNQKNEANQNTQKLKELQVRKLFPQQSDILGSTSLISPQSKDLTTSDLSSVSFNLESQN